MMYEQFWNHSAVQLDNFVVIFGGSFDDDDDDDDDDPPSPPVIWMYNIYTEEWTQQVIPKHVVDESSAPESFYGAVAVAISGTIYTFGGVGYGKYGDSVSTRNALWTLSKQKSGKFTWSLIEFQHDKTSPSPRTGHTGWEYSGKLWIFGGIGTSPELYLNDHGDIAGDNNHAANNQLLCYNPDSEMWTNPQCSGDVPSPRSHHASTIIKHKVWLFGGLNIKHILHDDIFELTMQSLTWTRVQNEQPCPQARRWCTLSALNNNKLVLHGGECGKNHDETLSDTWIMDLTSYSWRQYKSRKDHTRRSHTATVCLNNNVTIIGGCQADFEIYFHKPYNNVFHVMLEAESLQQLAARTIYKHQDEIKWNGLPNKLISLLGLSIKEKNQHAVPGSESLYPQSV